MWIVQATGGHLADSSKKRVSAIVQDFQIIFGVGDLRGEDVRDEFGVEVCKVEQGVAVSGFGEVNEPDEFTGASEDVFDVEVAMYKGLGSVDALAEKFGKVGKRVRKAVKKQVSSGFGEDGLAGGDEASDRVGGKIWGEPAHAEGWVSRDGNTGHGVAFAIGATFGVGEVFQGQDNAWGQFVTRVGRVGIWGKMSIQGGVWRSITRFEDVMCG